MLKYVKSLVVKATLVDSEKGALVKQEKNNTAQGKILDEHPFKVVKCGQLCKSVTHFVSLWFEVFKSQNPTASTNAFRYKFTVGSSEIETKLK